MRSPTQRKTGARSQAECHDCAQSHCRRRLVLFLHPKKKLSATQRHTLERTGPTTTRPRLCAPARTVVLRSGGEAQAIVSDSERAASCKAAHGRLLSHTPRFGVAARATSFERAA